MCPSDFLSRRHHRAVVTAVVAVGTTKKKSILIRKRRVATYPSRLHLGYMKPETERILRNLGVMARIQANEKLLTQNEFFEIHTPGWRQGATRQWLGENRQNNMTAVAECVRLAKMEITNILSEHADQINQPNQPRHGTVTSEVMIRENLRMHTN